MKNYSNRNLIAVLCLLLSLYSTRAFSTCGISSVNQTPTTVCPNTSVQFTANLIPGTPPGGTFTWSFGGTGNPITYPSGFSSSASLVVNYTAAGVCTTTYTFPLSVYNAISLNAGQGGYVSCSTTSTSITLGGSPTMSGGAGPLTYAWNNSLPTVPNPTVTVSAPLSSPITYTITATDGFCTASSSATFSSGPYIELMDGLNTSNDGVVPSDLETSVYNGSLFACGWSGDDFMVQNNTRQQSILSSGVVGHYAWLANYDPCSVKPLKWALAFKDPVPNCSASGYPSWTNGECTHPFTPNLAQDGSGGAYVAFNANGKGEIASVSSTGTTNFIGGGDALIFTDIKDDGGHHAIVTGYATATGTIRGVSFTTGDIFAASIDMTSTASLAYTWFVNTGLNINATSNSNVPSLAMLPNSASNFLICTIEKLQFRSVSTGAVVATNNGPSSLGHSLTTRVAADPSSGAASIFFLAGSKVFKYTYNTSTFVTTLSASTTIGAPPFYDIRVDGSSTNHGHVYIIGYNKVYGYASNLSALSWSPSTFQPCAYSGTPVAYDVATAADRCLALNPSDSKPLFIGGSNPTKPACAFESTYTFSNDNFGFIARIDLISVPGEFYKTSDGSETGEPAVQQAHYRMYPNPIQNELIIESENTGSMLNYSVVSIDGREVMSGLVPEGIGKVATTTLAPGMYLVKLQVGDHQYTQKIVKE